MADETKRMSKKVGLPPGTLVHIGEKRSDKVRIKVIEYGEEHFRERDLFTLDDYSPSKDASVVTWMNVDGLHRTEIIEKTGNLALNSGITSPAKSSSSSQMCSC